MSITTSNVRIETGVTGDGKRAMIDAYPAVSGYVMALRLMTACDGVFYLCVRPDDPRNAYLVAAPCAKWKNDIRDDGFTIVQRINPEQLIATASHHASEEAAPSGQDAKEEGR